MKSFETDLVASIPAMRRFARALAKCRNTADDLVQDTIERALRKQHLYQPVGPLEGWLMVMMRRCFWDTLRQEKSRPLADSCELQPEMMAGCRESQLDRVALTEMDRALARLHPTRREAVMLCGALELSYDEAALQAAVPVGTMKSRVSRGREELRGLLDAPSLRSPAKTGVLDLQQA